MSRSDVLLQSMNNFYNDESNATQFKNIISHGGKRGDRVSLRMIEKFITDYSKRTNFSIKSCDGQSFPVHVKYKSTLDGYSKKLFDPFARYERIDYVIPATGERVVTTVGQLNFLKWAIKNGIVDYIKENPDITKC